MIDEVVPSSDKLPLDDDIQVSPKSMAKKRS